MRLDALKNINAEGVAERYQVSLQISAENQYRSTLNGEGRVRVHRSKDCLVLDALKQAAGNFERRSSLCLHFHRQMQVRRLENDVDRIRRGQTVFDRCVPCPWKSDNLRMFGDELFQST